MQSDDSSNTATPHKTTHSGNGPSCLSPEALVPLPNERGFYAYIVRCADGTYYTGWTTRVDQRLAVHNRGKGAKYTRTRLPVTLMACWRFATKSEAMRFEHWIKQLPRAEKERIIAQP